MSMRVNINNLSIDDLVKIYISYLDKLANKDIPHDEIIGLNITQETNKVNIEIQGIRTFGILLLDKDGGKIIKESITLNNVYGIVSTEYDTIANCRLFAQGEYGIIYVFFTDKELAENYAQGIDDFKVVECNVVRKVV